jgi:hypothetical protein
MRWLLSNQRRSGGIHILRGSWPSLGLGTFMITAAGRDKQGRRAEAAEGDAGHADAGTHTSSDKTADRALTALSWPLCLIPG